MMAPARKSRIIIQIQLFPKLVLGRRRGLPGVGVGFGLGSAGMRVPLLFTGGELFGRIPNGPAADYAAAGHLHCTRAHGARSPRDAALERDMVWKWLKFWHRERAQGVPDWRVVLYTRAGCHLCDDAWALLEAARRRYGFALTKAGVDAD